MGTIKIFEKKMYWYVVSKVFREDLTKHKVGDVFGREKRHKDNGLMFCDTGKDYVTAYSVDFLISSNPNTTKQEMNKILDLAKSKWLKKQEDK